MGELDTSTCIKAGGTSSPEAANALEWRANGLQSFSLASVWPLAKIREAPTRPSPSGSQLQQVEISAISHHILDRHGPRRVQAGMNDSSEVIIFYLFETPTGDLAQRQRMELELEIRLGNDGAPRPHGTNCTAATPTASLRKQTTRSTQHPPGATQATQPRPTAPGRSTEHSTPAPSRRLQPRAVWRPAMGRGHLATRGAGGPYPSRAGVDTWRRES